jgi:hypothetical protein
MAAAVPANDVGRPDQPQVGLVDQGRRLERLAGLLLCHPRRREPPQFAVDKGQQLFCCAGVPLVDGG